MLSGPLGFYTITRTLVDAVNVALAASLGGAPDRAGVVPGSIAWDECDCGTLAGTVTRHYLSDAFAAERTTQSPCSAAYLVGDITITIVRCVPGPEGEALAPSVAALDGSAQVIISDAYVVLNTVACKLEEMEEAREIAAYLVRDQVYVGPLGGCVGSDLRVAVGVLRGVT